MIKRITAILCAVSMMVSLTACSEKTADYGGKTITGQVMAVDGSKVSLQIGELKEPNRNDQGRMPQPAQSGNDQALPDSFSTNGQIPPDGGIPKAILPQERKTLPLILRARLFR